MQPNTPTVIMPLALVRGLTPLTNQTLLQIALGFDNTVGTMNIGQLDKYESTKVDVIDKMERVVSGALGSGDGQDRGQQRVVTKKGVDVADIGVRWTKLILLVVWTLMESLKENGDFLDGNAESESAWNCKRVRTPFKVKFEDAMKEATRKYVIKELGVAADAWSRANPGTAAVDNFVNAVRNAGGAAGPALTQQEAVDAADDANGPTVQQTRAFLGAIAGGNINAYRYATGQATAAGNGGVVREAVPNLGELKFARPDNILSQGARDKLVTILNTGYTGNADDDRIHQLFDKNVEVGARKDEIINQKETLGTAVTAARDQRTFAQKLAFRPRGPGRQGAGAYAGPAIGGYNPARGFTGNLAQIFDGYQRA
jgi:hypothetical protein